MHQPAHSCFLHNPRYIFTLRQYKNDLKMGQSRSGSTGSMRLICPNCDATYEVPDEVIPEDGRDVQCSSCGITWYQYHPDHMPDDASLTVEETQDTKDDDVLPEPEPVEDTPAEDEDYQETPVETPPERELDPEVADILRQEAERETEAREAEALEVQTDLGLEQGEDEAERRAREARERMAKMRGEDGDDAADGNNDDDDDASLSDAIKDTVQQSVEGKVSEAAATAAAVGSRRELLPDIEEINSTLRSTTDREDAGDDPDPEAPVRTRKKRGFRRGFMLALIVFLLAILLYVYSPQIMKAVPQTESWLTGYVDWVDGLRAWLDGKLRSMLSWLDDKAAASEQGN